MPGGPVTAEQDQVVLELFRQRLQKNVGTDSIAVLQYGSMKKQLSPVVGSTAP